jgi:hypothetical protein
MPRFDGHPKCYRIKPEEPKMVPLDCAEDVPLGCEFQPNSSPGYRLRPTEIHAYGINNGAIRHLYAELFLHFKYTIDGKTWQPCGKFK